MSSTRKLTTGGEVVAWCTRCRLDLVHRIIAMVGGVPVKVECKTCGSHHRYRKPVEERAAEARVRAAAGPSAPGAGSKPRSASARALESAAQENERERLWQAKIVGQPAHAFVLYSPRQTFKDADLMRHAKFGDGVVTRVIDANKIEVLFRDGPRTLAHGLA